MATSSISPSLFPKPTSSNISLPETQSAEGSPVVPAHTPVSLATLQASQMKLPRKAIFQKIDDVLCRVQTSKGSATGFFIGKNLLCVPFDVMELKLLQRIDNQNANYEPLPIRFTCQGITYEAKCRTISLQAAYDFGCAIYFVEDSDFSNMPDLQLFQGKIEPGEKVYFGGFPLVQEDPTFHTGVISSVSDKDGRSSFTIDGTVVPGNSGGPVFILHNNTLKLAGIISSQVADLSPKDQETLLLMKELKRIREIQKDQSGMTYTLTLTTAQGPKEFKLNETDALCLALDLFQRNVSTGIGKAIHACHLIDVCDGKPASTRPSASYSIPVMRGERLPGMLAQDLTYRDWYHRHVKGQQLCVDIIKRQLGPAEDITPEEEKVLWDHYKTHPPYQGFAGLTPEEEFRKLKGKIDSAKPKAFKSNGANWRTQLQGLRTQLPNFQSEIDQIITRFNTQ